MSEGGSAGVVAATEGLGGRPNAGSKRGTKTVEREAGPQHGLHAVAGGEVGDDGRLAGEQRGGRADIEPLGEEARGGDAAHGFVEARKLLLRRLAIGFVGGEEMRHDALKPQRRAGTEAREDCGEIAGADALAAHAGVDFKMDGHGARLRARSASSRDQLVELPRLPCDRSELKLDGGRGLAGKDAADNKHPSLGTQRASDNAFFNAGDAEPFCAGTSHGGSTERERVAVGVGFDDGEKFGVGRGEAREKAKVFLESAGANLNPAGARCHGVRQRSVYGMGGDGMLAGRTRLRKTSLRG